jgi:hypothetical protein
MAYLPVIRTLGGCGGTLVSRLFAALPHVIVLSETNPRSANLFGGHLNPLAQLRRWHPSLLEDVADYDEAEIGHPPRFGEMLERLLVTAARLGRRIVLRDFNYVDFIGTPFLWPVAADSSLDAALEGRFRARSLYLVRHPADQLASLRSHAAIGRVLSAERFVSGAIAFVDASGGAPLFRYEALVQEPSAVFHAMCDALGVPFAPTAVADFASITTVTGNLTRVSQSKICLADPLPETTVVRQQLATVSGYDALLHRLGYAA